MTTLQPGLINISFPNWVRINEPGTVFREIRLVNRTTGTVFKAFLDGDDDENSDNPCRMYWRPLLPTEAGIVSGDTVLYNVTTGTPFRLFLLSEEEGEEGDSKAQLKWEPVS